MQVIWASWSPGGISLFDAKEQSGEAARKPKPTLQCRRLTDLVLYTKEHFLPFTAGRAVTGDDLHADSKLSVWVFARLRRVFPA